jgi:hypothetical protein
MNLQEQTNRIKQMMGVINEDNLPNVFKKMIDELGIINAIKMVGDYNLVMSYITKEHKIEFIKKKVYELNGEYDGEGIRLAELNISPILFYENDDEISQVEYLVPDGAYIDIYSKEYEQHIKDYKIPYEKLDEEILNELFKELMDITIEY